MNWPKKKLGEIVELHYGKGIPRHERKPDGKYPIFGANGELGRTDKYLVEGDAVIIGRKGTAGAVTRVSGKFWPADVTYYVFGNELIDVDFLYYLLMKIDLKQLATGIKPGINRNKVYKIEVLLPPISAQKRIVAHIQKLFTKIEEARHLQVRMLNDLSALHQSVLLDAFNH